MTGDICGSAPLMVYNALTATGISLLSIFQATSSSIPENHVVFVYVDKKKNLWLNFSNGKLGKFDTRKFVFTETKVIVPDENILTAERHLVEDDEGNLVLSFHKFMLVTYNASKNEFSPDTILSIRPATGV
jgi:hypothetical protein